MPAERTRSLKKEREDADGEWTLTLLPLVSLAAKKFM